MKIGKKNNQMMKGNEEQISMQLSEFRPTKISSVSLTLSIVVVLL